MTTVLDKPEVIATAQLMALKAAVKLEGLGMKHSSGRSMRKQACRVLGLRLNTKTDDVVGALNKEIDKRLKAINGPACPGCKLSEFMGPTLPRDAHTHYCSNCGVYSSPNGPKRCPECNDSTCKCVIAWNE